ncbi:hypothetical protein Tco_0159650, partial [Tanacetum coccineum]
MMVTLEFGSYKRKKNNRTPGPVFKGVQRRFEISVSELVTEFESGWKVDSGGYSRKLVEYCASKVLNEMCRNLKEEINEGRFARFTFDMMLAWETPSSADEESRT